jgi:hypothetical protein
MATPMEELKQALDMIDILFADEKYTEALEGLQLLKKTRSEKQWHSMIDRLIEVCQTKKKLKLFLSI